MDGNEPPGGGPGAPEPAAAPPSAAPRKRRGCLFWGLIALTLVVVTLVGSMVWSWWQIRQDLEAFSASEPLELPVESAVPVERAEEHLAWFIDSRQGRPAPAEITLSVDDLNTLIAEHSAAKEQKLPGRLHLTTEEGGDELWVEVSWPLGELPTFSGLEGRHFNARVRTEARYEDGELTLRFVEGERPDGEPVPERILDLANQWLRLEGQEMLEERIERFESIEFRDGAFRAVLAEEAEGPAEGDGAAAGNGASQGG